MRMTVAAAALALVPVAAFADPPTAEQVAKIDAALAAKDCEVDPANIEVEGGVFELDDAMCTSGQYDMKLDADFVVVEERKE